MRKPAYLLILLLVCVSCKNDRKDHGGKTPLVEIEGSFLYREDLEAVQPFGQSKDDSLLFAENYIRNWIEDALLYDKAQRNIQNTAEINELVENYRKSLIMHTYQQQLVHQRLVKDIPDQEIEDYYQQNKKLFELDYSLIKGLYIKVPLTAPELSQVREWYKTETHEAVEFLEKYSLQNAVSYKYFYDKWVPVSEVLAYLPLNVPDADAYLKTNRHLELKDDEFCYFLNVSEYCGKGDLEPFEFVRGEIKDMLVNLKQVSFMDEIKDGLYYQAVRSKSIKYHY